MELLNTYISEHMKNPKFTNNQGWATYYSVGEKAAELLNSILPKLENEVLAIHYYVSTGVAGPHSDKGYTVGGRTFIIPLKQSNAHTVVFNQYMERDVDNKSFFANAPYANTVVNKKHKQINLSHFSNTESKKLTIETVFPWVLGDILIFDRKKIHSSDRFITENTVSKEAIVIWSEIK